MIQYFNLVYRMFLEGMKSVKRIVISQIRILGIKWEINIDQFFN